MNYKATQSVIEDIHRPGRKKIKQNMYLMHLEKDENILDLICRKEGKLVKNEKTESPKEETRDSKE